MAVFIAGALLFMLLVAMALALFTTARRLRQAEAELADYRRDYGFLKVDDPTMLQAVALWSPERGRWRWRVHLPAGKYEICNGTTRIPAEGVVDSRLSESDLLDSVDSDISISAAVYKDPRNTGWMCKIMFEGTTISFPAPASFPEAWEESDSPSPCRDSGVLWNQGPKSVSPEEPLVLLRRRVGERRAKDVFDTESADGLMIWIRRTGSASGQDTRWARVGKEVEKWSESHHESSKDGGTRRP